MGRPLPIKSEPKRFRFGSMRMEDRMKKKGYLLQVS